MSLAHLLVLVRAAGETVAQVVLRLQLEASEEGMRKRLLHADAARGLELHHLGQQVNSLGATAELGAGLNQVLVTVHLPLGESGLHFRKVVSTLPELVADGRAQALENLEDLPDLALAIEEGLAVSQLVENAAN